MKATNGKWRVLVLDDNAVVLRAIQLFLERHEFRVLTAQTLADLDSHLEGTESPDAIVLDVHTPEAFGDDVGMVLREVRAMQVPILLYSSLDEAELADRAKTAGVDGYVHKSGGSMALLERLRSVLS